MVSQVAAERDALKEAAQASTCSKRKREVTPDANWCCSICHEVPSVDRYPNLLSRANVCKQFLDSVFQCTVLPALCIRFVMGRTSNPKASSYYLCRHMVCKQVLMDPMVLPCGHNFDSDCLRTWVDSKNTDDLRVCPICRAAVPSTLPSVRIL